MTMKAKNCFITNNCNICDASAQEDVRNFIAIKAKHRCLKYVMLVLKKIFEIFVAIKVKNPLNHQGLKFFIYGKMDFSFSVNCYKSEKGN